MKAMAAKRAGAGLCSAQYLSRRVSRFESKAKQAVRPDGSEKQAADTKSTRRHAAPCHSSSDHLLLYSSPYTDHLSPQSPRPSNFSFSPDSNRADGARAASITTQTELSLGGDGPLGIPDVGAELHR